MPPAEHDQHPSAPPALPPASAKPGPDPDPDRPSRAPSDSAPDSSRARFPTSPFSGRPSAASSRHFLTVLPPVECVPCARARSCMLTLASSFPAHPPHPRAAAAGTTANLNRGCLLPLYPTLGGQLYAIAREYGLPSIGGLSVYLVDDGFGSLGPCVGDSAWRGIWSPFFADDGPLNQPQSASYSSASFPSRSAPSPAYGIDPDSSFAVSVPRIPIVGRIEWAVEPLRAPWWPAWLAETRTAAGLSAQPLDSTPGQPEMYAAPDISSPHTPGRTISFSQRERERDPPSSSGGWPAHKPLTLGTTEIANNAPPFISGHSSSSIVGASRSERGLSSPRVSMTPATSRTLARARVARLRSLPQMQLQALARSASPGRVPIHSPRASRVASTPSPRTFPHAPGSVPLPPRPLPESEPQVAAPRRPPVLPVVSMAERRGSRSLSLLSHPPSIDFSTRRPNTSSSKDRASSQTGPMGPVLPSDYWSSQLPMPSTQQDAAGPSPPQMASDLWPTPDPGAEADSESKDDTKSLDEKTGSAAQPDSQRAPAAILFGAEPGTSSSAHVMEAPAVHASPPPQDASRAISSPAQEADDLTSCIPDPRSRSGAPSLPHKQTDSSGGEEDQPDAQRRASDASSQANEAQGFKSDWRDTPYEPLGDVVPSTESVDAAPMPETKQMSEPGAPAPAVANVAPSPAPQRQSRLEAWQAFDLDEEEWEALASTQPGPTMLHNSSSTHASASQVEDGRLSSASAPGQRPLSDLSLSSLGFNMDVDPPPGVGPVAEQVRELEASEQQPEESEMPSPDDIGDVLSLWADPQRPQNPSSFLLSPLHLDTPQFNAESQQGHTDLNEHAVYSPMVEAEEGDQTQGISESHSQHTVIALSASSAERESTGNADRGSTLSPPSLDAAGAVPSAKFSSSGTGGPALPESWSEWSLHPSQSLTEADRAAVREIIDTPHAMSTASSQTRQDASGHPESQPKAHQRVDPASPREPKSEGSLPVLVQRSESVNTELSSNGAGDPLTTIEKALQLLSPSGTSRDVRGPAGCGSSPASTGLKGSVSTHHSLAAALTRPDPLRKSSLGLERTSKYEVEVPAPRSISLVETMHTAASLPNSISMDLSRASLAVADPTTAISPVKRRYAPSTLVEPSEAEAQPDSLELPALETPCPNPPRPPSIGTAGASLPAAPDAPTVTDTEDEYHSVLGSPEQTNAGMSPMLASPHAPATSSSPQDTSALYGTPFDSDEMQNSALPPPAPMNPERHLIPLEHSAAPSASPISSKGGASNVSPSQMVLQEPESDAATGWLPASEMGDVDHHYPENSHQPNTAAEQGTTEQQESEDGDMTGSTAMPGSLFDHTIRVGQSGPSSSHSIETIYSRPSATDMLDSEDAPAVPPTVPEVEETSGSGQGAFPSSDPATPDAQEHDATPRPAPTPFQAPLANENSSLERGTLNIRTAGRSLLRTHR